MGALRGIAGRPIVLKRYVNGADEEPFFQKRAPDNHPDWVETVELVLSLRTHGARSGHPRRRPAPLDREPRLHRSQSAPVRADDLEHPDELRVDLDPGPGVGWTQCASVALVVRDVLDDHGLRGWPKTSGSRGIHVNVRIEQRWTLRPGATRGAGDRARGRAARARPRDEQVVEGGAPRRLPRLQPEREGSHRGLGVLGAADARRARVGAARMGRSRGRRSRGVHARHRACAFAERGDASAGIDEAAARSNSCSRFPRRRKQKDSATRRGRRTTRSRTASHRALRRRKRRRRARAPADENRRNR
jgi:bifunctional non-homologous end joining protein LigD